MPYDLGDTVRLAADCKDAGGTLTNAASVELVITLPDGTTVTPTVTNPPADTGRYVYDYVTTQPGRHLVRWAFTSPSTAYTDAFDVREADPPLILSLTDARKHLRLQGTADDEELRLYVEATTGIVEYYVGAVVRRTVTDVHHGGPAIALDKTPVLELTSITPMVAGGIAYSPGDIDVDTESGVLRLKGGSWFARGPYRITYTAGRATVPAPILLASVEIIRHLWRTRQADRTGQVRPAGDDEVLVPGYGWAIPRRCVEMLTPYMSPEGVA